MTDRATARLVYIDGLRGIAAICVLVQHTCEIISSHAAAPASILAAIDVILLRGINLGHFGVALFFLVSGFVIPFSFREPAPLRRFAISRLFRLYPAYWLSLLLLVAVSLATGRTLPSPTTLLVNLTMLQRYLGQPDAIPIYWTLAVEIAFYALCALLFARCLLGNARALATFALVLTSTSIGLAALGIARGQALPAGLPENLALMLLGTLLRRAALAGDAAARRLVPIIIAAIAVAIPMAEWAATAAALKDAPAAIAFTTGAWAAILAFLLCLRGRPDFGAVLGWLGAVSYSVYLIHAPMLMLCGKMLVDGGTTTGAPFAVMALALTLGGSWLIWLWVEKPCITLGHVLAPARVPTPSRATG